MTPYRRKRIAEPAVVGVLQTLARGGPTSSTPSLRRSRTVVFVLEDEASLIMFNYLTNQAVDCSERAYRLLCRSGEWRAISELVAGEAELEAAYAEIAAMVEGGFLLVEDTELARDEEAFAEAWEWDVRAGLFHLAIKDPLMMTREEVIADLSERARARSLVPLFMTNERFDVVVSLGRPSADDAFFDVLGKRRTWRDWLPTPLPLETLRDALFAGVGITAFVEEPIAGMGALPLKMTPSGGARNPFEAYVFVRNVERLTAGIYHYSASEHTLGLVRSSPMPWGRELLAGQEWTDEAAAIVVLVACFERTMWKYSHPMAYRAVLIEAGHIGQNMMLAATRHGACAGPTAALCDDTIEEALSLHRVTQAATYALVLGLPDLNRRDHLVTG
jgi:SagB-type dehydrogenase family enzyme